MSSVEPWRRLESDEELRAVRISARVGHREKVWLRVVQVEVFVIELVSVDRLATCAISSSEVTTLSHEASDDSVESASLEAEAFLTSAELLEVLGGLGSVSSKSDCDSASTLAANGNVKVDVCVNSLCHILLILSFCFINKL